MKDQTGAPSPSEQGRQNITLLASSSVSRVRAAEILVSEDIMADLFRTRLSWLFPKNAVLSKCRAKVLMDRLSSRQVVSYQLIFSGNEKPVTLVLKRYADKSEGEKTYSAMRILWNNGFNRESNLKIPEPFSYFEELGLLVIEKAHGMLLRKNLTQSGPVALARMRSVARWLTKLHHLNADLERISPHPDEEPSLKEFVRGVGSKEPRLLPKMEGLASAILMKLSTFTNAPMTPVHGDFQCGNIFVYKDAVTVIDFDKFCRSDPARDLGYMIAHMRAMALWENALQGSVYSGLKAFWEEYLASAPAGERKSLSARASLFAARKCLQNIDYMVAYMSPGAMEIVSVLLDEAGRFSETNSVEEVLQVPILSGREPGKSP